MLAVVWWFCSFRSAIRGRASGCCDGGSICLEAFVLPPSVWNELQLLSPAPKKKGISCSPLECVGESHGGKALGKPWEATEDNFSPVSLSTAFPNHHPNHHPDLLSSARQPGASDVLTLSAAGAGQAAAPIYLENGEGRGEEIQSHLQAVMPGPGPARAIPAPGPCAGLRCALCGFCCRGTFVQYVLLGGLCPKLNLTPAASCLILWSGWKVELSGACSVLALFIFRWKFL